MTTLIIFFGGIVIGICLLCIIGGVRLDILKKRGRAMNIDDDFDMDMVKFFWWVGLLLYCVVSLIGAIGGIWFLIEKIMR